MASMLLIYPPGARSVEAPIGIARIASFLRLSGQEARCIDLCAEGIEYLLGIELKAEEGDTWTRGAINRRDRAVQDLRDARAYSNPARYARAIGDLGRVLKAASRGSGALASLADYRDLARSPLRRADLIDSALHFETNVFRPLFEDRLGPAVSSMEDGWAGLSICFLSQALCAFAAIGYLRSARPDIRIAIGGGLVTSWVTTGLIDRKESFGGLVDAVLPGPGEESIGDLLGAEGGSTASGLDLDDFDQGLYLSPTRIVPYNFSFGCPWKRCAFCPEKAEDMPYRGIPARMASIELSRLRERYAPGLFHFTDSEVSPLYLRELASNPPGAPWYGFARFSRALLDSEFCESLSASGCVMLQLGLESGDQDVLDRMGKGTRLEEIDAVLKNLKAAGIGSYIYIMLGAPYEDRDAAMRTRNFLRERAELIDFLNVAIFNLPAASEDAKRLETSGFYEGELSLYREFKHPKAWNRQQLRRFIALDLKGSPEIRSIIARTPPVFTSSHAPFLLKSRIAL
jgi:hypothetical protein